MAQLNTVVARERLQLPEGGLLRAMERHADSARALVRSWQDVHAGPA
jgi:hypothetical protein